MIARSIVTENYRNLFAGKIEFADGVNVISGQNGQGKTNLLEAICLFTGVRSFRGAKNVELITKGEKFSRLELDFFAEKRDQSASLIITDKKQATLNGVKLAAATGFIGRFCAVVFSPDNMSLVKGGSTERRRFLDAAISQQFPAYPRLLVEYNRILAQRNAFLKKSATTERREESAAALRRRCGPLRTAETEIEELRRGRSGDPEQHRARDRQDS